jgi:hypothetical protein
MVRIVTAAVFGGFKRIIQILKKSHFGTVLARNRKASRSLAAPTKDKGPFWGL